MALSDFEKYVASKGGNATVPAADSIWDRGSKYSGVGSNPIPSATTPTAGNFGANVGNNLPSVGDLRAPGLSISNGSANLGVAGSAWEQGKNQASQTVANATGKDYVPYVEQQLQEALKTTVTPPVSMVSPSGVITKPTPPVTEVQPGTGGTPGITPGGAGGMGDGGAGGVAGAGKLPTVADMSDYIREIYAQQENQNLEALAGAYEKQLAAIDAEQAALPQYYYEAGRQQQGQNALERMAMNERFAASGLGSGTSGQAALAQSMADQNEMGAIRRAEAKALSDVEAKRSALAVEYQGKVREAIMQNNTELAKALYSEAQRVDASMVETALMQAELDAQAEQRAYERNYTKEQNNLESLTAKAKLLASAGDFSGYKALGYTDDEIAVLKGYWDAENAPKPSGGGYTPPSNMSLTTAKQLAESGYITDEVVSVLAANGYDAGALEYLYGYTPGGTVQGATAGAAQPLQSAQAISLYGALQNGAMDAEGASYIIQSGIDHGTISPAEAEYIFKAFGL